MALIKQHGKKQTDYEHLIAEAGFRKPTLLQQLVLPAILEGRDVDAESGIHPGKTLAIAVSILLKLNRTKPGVKAVVITQDREQAQKVYRALTQSLTAFTQGSATVVIGFSDLIKKEARQLAEQPDIVIGTPSRLIDHIRRANVELGSVERVFIDEDEAFETEFESDICFILSKIRDSVQIVRFTFAREETYRNLEQLLKRPVTIREKDFTRDHGVIEYTSICTDNKEELALKLLMALGFESAVVVMDSASGAKQLVTALRQVRIEGRAAHRETGRGRSDGGTVNREGLDVLVIPQAMLARISLEGVSHIINCEPSLWETDFRKHINLSQLDRAVIQCLTLVTPEEEKELDEMQERERVNMQKKQPPTNADILKGTIARLLENAGRGGKPEEMKQYLDAVKRGVPVGKRSLFIASLLKGMVHSLVAKKVEFVTLFLGIGRLRDAGPRDIAGLFMNALPIDQSSLGDIRVFDNYSFVEIDKDFADKAITVLADKDFKGKKLVINYSRKKEEKRSFGGPRRYKRD